MTIAGSKKRSGDREPKASSGNNKDLTDPSIHQSTHTKINPAEILSQYKNASLEFGSGAVPAKIAPADDADGNAAAYRLARELDHFIAKGLDPSLVENNTISLESKAGESIADIQLQTVRKLRQERNWIPLLLGWLNLKDHPAVQVESLLALTNIAELCAQQSYVTSSSSTGAAAGQAAAAKVPGSHHSQGQLGPSNSVPPLYSFSPVDSSTGSTASPYLYPSLVPPAPGSVPFPPLSFSQTLSPEALAAFDASLSSTIQQSRFRDPKSRSSSAQRSSLSFPGVSTSGSQSFSPSLSGPQAGTAGSPSSFLPPPTPVSTQGADLSSFPQQLSANSQHLLLRHADAIPTLISLLSSPNKEVYEQAMWILGSVAAGDSTGSSNNSSASSSNSESGRDKPVAARDVILAAGVMKQLLRCLESHQTNLSLQRIGSWTLSNLVEGIFQQQSHGKSSSKSSDYLSSDEVDMHIMLPVLKRLLRLADAEVLSYTCWTLSHLCDGPSSHISAVVTTMRDQNAPRGGLVPRLVELLGHPSWRVTKPALRTIGNIVCAECGDDNNHSSSSPTDYTEVILECNAVPKLKELVTHNNREIQKEACWTLSNIAAGTVDQIQAVIDSGAIPPLVKLVSNKGTDQEVRSEACWVVLNATSCGSDSQIEVLVDEGCVSVLGVLLEEASMVMMALEGLERVLQVEEAREVAKRASGDSNDQQCTPTLVSASLIEKALDEHNSSAVTKRASRIWKQHFVSCALCNKSFSKHRTTDATFCEECKCYVCSNCDCQIYHLSYQEELWAATEEQTEAKKTAKKSKKAKKKEKLKQKQMQQVKNKPHASDPSTYINGDGTRAISSTKLNSSDDSLGGIQGGTSSKIPMVDAPHLHENHDEILKSEGSPMGSDGEDEDAQDDEDDDEDDADTDHQQPPIDFVLYLQQTGSIIALAKLMDEMESTAG